MLLITILLMVISVQAAYFSFKPYTIIQPDGNKIDCFVSGDEYFNWLHDKDGYTLIQAVDGYYYYAVTVSGVLKPGNYIAGKVNPAEKGLTAWAKISDDDYLVRRNQFQSNNNRVVTSPLTGILNNIVIYIRFSDDPEFSVTRQFYDDCFNLSPGVSLKSYYSEVSYNQLNINSSHYPACSMNVNLSYRNPHPRAYYQPFNATANPTGYSNDNERISREHTLLKNAVEWVSINSPVPANLNIDADNDGNVDNVSFVVKGFNGAWSQLLWSHNWQLFSYNVLINGKRVWEYTFDPESQMDVKTLSHEIFHTLGAPDLYHYNNNGVQPAGDWDLMEQGSGHMGAWMKYRYSNHTWISDIPEITTSGTYSLNPLSEQGSNCFRIASPNSASEFFILEYRKAEGLFEGNLPGSGILVYRIDSTYTGNVTGPPDEVYIYRPNGTKLYNGSPSNAAFSLETGRTAINDATNPGCFLQDGGAGGLQIYDISQAGATISFSVQINEIGVPVNLNASPLSCVEISLDWQKNSNNNNVLLVYNTIDSFGSPLNGAIYSAGNSLPGGGTVLYSGNGSNYIHSGLTGHATYYYRAFSVTAGNSYSNHASANATTNCGSYYIPFAENFNATAIPSCWSLQHSGAGTIDNWDVSPSNMAGGNGNEMRSTFQQVNSGMTRLVTPVLNTTGMASLNLSFRHTLDDWAPGATLHVQSSSDGINWTNEAWALPTSSNNNVGPVVVNTTILQNLNSPHTYIAFTVEGNLYSYDFWYIDDVSVSCAGTLPVLISATANPAEGGIVTGAGTYLYGQAVALTATPNDGWNFLGWSENGEIVSTSGVYCFSASPRNLQANFSNSEAMVGLSASPAIAGTTSGAGIYPVGSTATINALPNAGYEFAGWLNNGNIVSESSFWSFTVVATVNLVAQFRQQQVKMYTISLEAQPAEGGRIAGGGSYASASEITINAEPNPGWIFESWEENGAVLSRQPGFTFTVDRDYSLVAVFREVLGILASASPEIAGNASGGGEYLSGDMATVQAFSNPGWMFSRWSLNDVEVSSDSVYSFIATTDCNLKAIFVSGVGKPENKSTEVKLYPNPAKGLIHIAYTGNDPLSEIKLFNFYGQMVRRSVLSSPDNLFQTDLSGLAAGSYTACVITRSGKEIKRKLLVLCSE